jgi:hypothetical protein
MQARGMQTGVSLANINEDEELWRNKTALKKSGTKNMTLGPRPAVLSNTETHGRTIDHT